MCGIAGYFGPKKFAPSSNQIKNCINLMKRRGPDFQDFIKKDFKDITSIMIHSRLSIIDPVDNSNQPMEDQNGIISFNGEIYNYLELIKKYNFKKLKTKSDTEVLLKYLNQNKSIPKDDLDGMWTYAYFNKKKENLILCKDWFGEKPLYYLFNNKALYYGSNINYIISLSKTVYSLNEEKITSFLSYGFKSLFLKDDTFDKKIKMLDSAEAILIDKNLKIKKFETWKKKPKIGKLSNNYTQSKLSLKNLLKETFSTRFRSDFPIACLLSGGVDSTAIAAIAKKFFKIDLKCYSVFTNDKNYNESKQIKSFCKNLNIKSNFIKMNRMDNYKFLENIISETYFPLCSVSYLAYANLNKAAKDDGYRVILSGLGGDEMFGGYYIHQMNYLVANSKKKNFDTLYRTWEKYTKPFIRSKILYDFEYYKQEIKKKYPSFHEKNEIKKYLNVNSYPQVQEKKYSNNFFRNQLNTDLFRDSVPSNNLTSDQISMHFSIENRNPFLSKSIFNFSNSLPDDFLINNGYGKAILRDSLSGVVPDSILKLREKIGFYASINDFFDINSKEFKDRLFQSNFINKFININNINKILNKDYINNIESKLIFCILNLAILTQQ